MSSVELSGLMDSVGIYIDPRVRFERWVEEDSTIDDEPPSLKSDLDFLLGVCKQSMSHLLPNVDNQMIDDEWLTHEK